jgi:hypothetical protein
MLSLQGRGGRDSREEVPSSRPKTRSEEMRRAYPAAAGQLPRQSMAARHRSRLPARRPGLGADPFRTQPRVTTHEGRGGQHIVNAVSLEAAQCTHETEQRRAKHDHGLSSQIKAPEPHGVVPSSLTT